MAYSSSLRVVLYIRLIELLFWWQYGHAQCPTYVALQRRQMENFGACRLMWAMRL